MRNANVLITSVVFQFVIALGKGKLKEKERGPMDAVDMSARRCVLFDFDGTLANTLPYIVATATRVLKAHGFDDARIGDASRLVGPPFPEAFSQVYGVSAAEAAAITADYRSIYDHLGPEAHPLFEGMKDVLLALKAANKNVAIASSKRQVLITQSLENLGILDLFDVVSAKRAEGHGSKVEIITTALELLEAPASDCVMVGDRSYDIVGAHEVGVPCVAVEFGTASHKELVDAGADAIAHSASELARILLGNNAEHACV